MDGIIVGYDGSGHSLRALKWAAREATIRRAQLTILSVCQTPPDRWSPGSPGVGQPERAAGGAGDDALQKARTLAEEQAGKIAGAGIPRPRVAVRAVRGSPAEELLRLSVDADMVVVGSRGAGGFPKLLLGSASSYLAHHAHCPVVVIPDSDI